jgi:hypothetical protein
MKANISVAYVNNVPMAQGELSIVLSDNAEKVMRHSSALAKKIQDIGANVLLINCGMSNRRFREHAGYPEGAHQPHYVIRTSYRGDLIGERDEIEQLVSACKIGVIIIAGWEWTSSNHRRKERLIYFLRELMAEEDCAIIVYSQAPTKPVIGKYDRGGVGKLSMLAAAIITDETAYDLETLKPKPLPLVVNSEDDNRMAEESARLLINKINGLQGEKPPITLRGSSQSDGRIRSEEWLKKSMKQRDEKEKKDENEGSAEFVEA